MSRRITGVIFIAIAACLYATRFLTAAIWGSGFTNWNAEHFYNLLNHTDQGLTLASLMALILGFIYLIWGEIQELKHIRKDDKENDH